MYAVWLGMAPTTWAVKVASNLWDGFHDRVLSCLHVHASNLVVSSRSCLDSCSLVCDVRLTLFPSPSMLGWAAACAGYHEVLVVSYSPLTRHHCNQKGLTIANQCYTSDQGSRPRKRTNHSLTCCCGAAPRRVMSAICDLIDKFSPSSSAPKHVLAIYCPASLILCLVLSGRYFPNF